MTVLVKIKNVYGNDLIYPANSLAVTFTELLGKKTLSMIDIEKIKKLGFSVEVESQKL